MGVFPIITIILSFLILTTTKLQYIASVFRHGARYPVNDLYDANQTSKFQGLLTSVGLRQQYLLGSYLKYDYITDLKFLPQKLDPNNVEVISTSVSRTVQSALAHLYGLFTVGNGWEIPSAINSDKLMPPFQSNFTSQIQSTQSNFALQLGFQPIPIRTADDLMNYCPKYGVLTTKRLQQITKNLTQFQTQNTLFISKMVTLFNLSALQITIQTMSDLYDTINCDLNLGRPLPKLFDQSDLKHLKFISNYYQALIFDGNFSKLLATPLLSLLKSNMDRTIQVQTNLKKLSIVSTHQTTILPIMTLLNLTSAQCLYARYKNQSSTSLNCMEPPAFAANMIIELHEDETFQHTIKIRYNGQYVYLCQKKSTQCRYQELMERMTYKFVDYVKICNTGEY